MITNLTKLDLNIFIEVLVRIGEIQVKYSAFYYLQFESVHGKAVNDPTIDYEVLSYLK